MPIKGGFRHEVENLTRAIFGARLHVEEIARAASALVKIDLTQVDTEFGETTGVGEIFDQFEEMQLFFNRLTDAEADLQLALLRAGKEEWELAGIAKEMDKMSEGIVDVRGLKDNDN